MFIGALKILIVDDHLPMRALLQSVLKAVGARHIRTVRDAAGAISALRVLPADLMIVDQKLAGVSGLDLVRKVRISPNDAVARMRILMLTAHGDMRHVEAARDGGVDEFLVKPFSPANLLQRMDAALTHSRTFVRNQGFHGPDRRRRDLRPPEGVDRRRADLEFEDI